MHRTATTLRTTKRRCLAKTVERSLTAASTALPLPQANALDTPSASSAPSAETERGTMKELAALTLSSGR